MESRTKIFFAREFRQNPTRSERILWNALRRKDFLGYKFRRQHVIEGYILDCYCHKLKLAIEIDGGIHKYQIQEDIERQKIIEKQDITFFRVNSKDVENNIRGVLRELKKFIEDL